MLTLEEDPGIFLDYVRQIASVSDERFETSYDDVGEGDTLLIFKRGDSSPAKVFDTTVSPPNVLCDIINKNMAHLIKKIEVTPPNIVMRLLGNMDAAIDQIMKDFKATETTKGSLTQNLGERGVLVNFTSEPLNRHVPSAMFYKRALIIDKPFGQLLAFLRARCQEYLNMAMGSPDWNEIEITLFDAMDQFDLHYRRLITVLQGLDVGVMAGEDWVPEYTVALRKSEVYQIRLLTPLSPRDIKRIALALEYDASGRRVCDFDVYSNKKKLGWATERSLNKGYARGDIGVLHRKRLLSSLPGEAKAALLKLDEQIDRSGPLKG
jgi:hypothetical protein